MKIYRNTTGKMTTVVISANKRILINAVDTRLSEEAYNEVRKIHPNLLVEVPIDVKETDKKDVNNEITKKKEEKIVLKEPIEFKNKMVIKELDDENLEDLEVIIEPKEEVLKEENPVKTKRGGRKKGSKNKKIKNE